VGIVYLGLLAPCCQVVGIEIGISIQLVCLILVTVLALTIEILFLDILKFSITISRDETSVLATL